MNAMEMKQAYDDLYGYMADSQNPENMKAFGKVMTEMFYWMADNKSELASDMLDKLCAIKWHNYLTPKEADAIVAQMNPKAPWSREQWKAAMAQYDYPLEEEPYYNRCALYVTMNMVMSDSSSTIGNYVSGDDLFKFVHDLAVDKLKDADGKFNIRSYFNV